MVNRWQFSTVFSSHIKFGEVRMCVIMFFFLFLSNILEIDLTSVQWYWIFKSNCAFPHKYRNIVGGRHTNFEVCIQNFTFLLCPIKDSTSKLNIFSKQLKSWYIFYSKIQSWKTLKILLECQQNVFACQTFNFFS